MRRSNVVGLVLVLILAATGVAVALARRDDGSPRATPSPSASQSLTPSPSATTPFPTPTSRPSPTGPGPRNKQYDVVYATGVTPDDGAAAVAAANGVVIHENAAVGVATVRANDDFVARAMKDKRFHGVVTNRAVGRPPAVDTSRSSPRGAGVTRADLTSLQWDMDAIHVADAHKATKGHKGVLVAVIDTGVDGTHPDLAPAFDKALSRNFVTDHPGADGPCEVPSCIDAPDHDGDGHGTHVAGTIAAADDGRGMTGVAPDVTLINLRAGQDSGLFLLMPTVDALVYAGDIGVDVANMSFFVDPWLFNCTASPNDSAADRYEQKALIEGVRRATEYAHAHGVTMIAAAGNEHVDLSAPTVDTFSPDFPKGAARTRRVDNACLVLPTELPHVIQVSAVGRDLVKTDYSDYGLGEITVTAPGGATTYANGSNPSTQNLVLSTYPESLARAEGAVGRDGSARSSTLAASCNGAKCAYYRWFSGTSMAAPHAAGVAALIVSAFGQSDPKHPGQLTMNPATVAKVLQDSARALACPSPATLRYPGRSYTATCRGTTERNGFYGFGLVDALAATKAQP